MADDSKHYAKPLFLIRPKSMSRSDIRRAERHAGIIVVECEDPEAARFLQPPPDADIPMQSRAALEIMRMVLRSQDQNFNRATLTKWFVDILINSTPPKTVPPVKGK